MTDTPRARPAPPAVDAATYDTRYYLDCCAGHEEWARSGGAEVSPAYHGFAIAAGIGEGDVVVDLGTGRGEMLAVAVEYGARAAVGVEYSPEAVALAARTLAVRGVHHRCAAVLGDVRVLPLRDGVADLVTMLDVVEHLSPAELDAALAEAHRVLRPGGRVFVHTFPTRTVYRVYRAQRLLAPWRLRRWPAEPRHPLEVTMHVNEQTRRSLRHALRRAGFDATVERGEWVYTDFVPSPRARRVYHRLAAHRLTAGLGVANLFGRGTRPA